MTMVDPPQLGPSTMPQDPFNSHLIALLSIYELGPYPGATVPVPRYNGPSSWETEEILRSLGSIAKRMWVAEERVRTKTAKSEKIEENEKRLGYSTSTVDSTSTTPLAGGTQDAQTPLAPAGSPLMTLSFDGLDSSFAAAAPAPVAAPPAETAIVRDLPTCCQACGHIIAHSMLLDPSPSSSSTSSTDPLSTSESSPLSATEELKLLKAQVQDVARVCNAVARGDLSQKITVPVQDVVMVQLKDVINGMVDQLSAFASEVTRVALEVGTQGILGGQVRVEGVQGTWADLTRNVNKMASNLTDQVRSISEVTKAVAAGDLTKFVNVDVQGEMLDLKMTVNSMYPHIPLRPYLLDYDTLLGVVFAIPPIFFRSQSPFIFAFAFILVGFSLLSSDPLSRIDGSLQCF
ncbi:hypothetical protein D9611_014713 [Ephemerocybe angulata]|uniref:HAMP domain-containing protein n=1 Tax=Ephemerocybe angulata TaxID=980116 RepID=A0A8H5ERJ7_9AGAR|nr:hypothetical protein D9611_014713 [Tulosesus angulatus]